MARIVAGMGVPHTPVFPSVIAVGDPNNETSMHFQRVADALDRAKPDVIIMFDSDHLNTFFLDNMPTLSIGVAPRTSGPNDGTAGLRDVTLQMPEALAGHVRDSCVESDFDVALTQEFTVDHSILVPLHYLRPAADLPVLPVFINGLVPPLPGAARCWALGQAVREAVNSWPDHLRVAVIASGSFSLDVGGPHIRPGQLFGVPAPDWVETVSGHLLRGNYDAVVEAAGRQQLAAAGNVGGELLNWIAMLAAVGADRPAFLDVQPDLGHGFGFWEAKS